MISLVLAAAAKQKEKNQQKIFKMLKMSVGKHHAACNNITNSMNKNVAYNRSFHFTAFYPMGPVVYASALLDLSPAQNAIFSQ